MRLTISGPVLLPEGQITLATVVVEDGMIQSVEPGRIASPTIATGGLIAPGFVDLQCNGAYGADLTADPGGVARVAARLPATGVTAFLPTIITSPFATYRERLAELGAVALLATGARVLGVHLEGPYLNPARRGAHDPAYLRPVDVAEILGWADPTLTRIVTLAPELPGALEAIRALRARGIVVSAGHSAATFEQAQAGFRAGIAWGTHLFNAMGELHHREPGLPGALLAAPFPCGLIPDGQHVHPAVVQLAYRAKGPAGLTIVTDAMAAMGMPPGGYALAERRVIVDEDSARLPDGTLAGSILCMDQAVRNMIAFTGCSPAAAIRMASTTPADALGLSGRGRVAPGCHADLVLLDGGLHVTHTIVGGEVVCG